MRFFKNMRAADAAEDPAVAARLNGIATRSRAEASLYEAVKKAQQSQGRMRFSRGFKAAPK